MIVNDRCLNEQLPLCRRPDGYRRMPRLHYGGALLRKVQYRLPHRRADGAAFAFTMVTPLGEHVCGAQQQGQREHRAKAKRQEPAETEGRDERISHYTCF